MEQMKISRRNANRAESKRKEKRKNRSMKSYENNFPKDKKTSTYKKVLVATT
jgi:hypothetical protein